MASASARQVGRITTAYRAIPADAQPLAGADVAEIVAADTADLTLGEERGAYRVTGANGANGARAAEGNPLSCITGDAKSVMGAVLDGAFSVQMRHFLRLVLDRTFGNAGWQKR